MVSASCSANSIKPARSEKFITFNLISSFFFHHPPHSKWMTNNLSHFFLITIDVNDEKRSWMPDFMDQNGWKNQHRPVIKKYSPTFIHNFQLPSFARWVNYTIWSCFTQQVPMVFHIIPTVVEKVSNARDEKLINIKKMATIFLRRWPLWAIRDSSHFGICVLHAIWLRRFVANLGQLCMVMKMLRFGYRLLLVKFVRKYFNFSTKSIFMKLVVFDVRVEKLTG